jgi:uncharacterized membrane protein YbhN (UPF0104 family)
MVRRVLALVLCALVLYGVAPAVLGLLDAWPQVVDIRPYWFAAMVAAQVASWGSTWLLQRLAVDARSWWPVVTSQLASGALGRVLPGGPAAAGAVQFRMLVQAGVSPSLAGLGIGVSSIVLLGTLAALPLLSLPAIVLGLAVPTRLWQAAAVGGAVFLALLAVGGTLMASDRALLAAGRLGVRAGKRLRPRHPPAADLPERLRDQRDLVRRAFGARWWEAVAGASGRWLFDWLTLLTALAATGQQPRPTLVLLAFCAAQLLAQVPITPGGLGVVEAGLTGALVLIGVPAGAAAAATLAYRLVSYWLALPAGGLAWLFHRRRVRAGDAGIPRVAAG